MVNKLAALYTDGDMAIFVVVVSVVVGIVGPRQQQWSGLTFNTQHLKKRRRWCVVSRIDSNKLAIC